MRIFRTALLAAWTLGLAAAPVALAAGVVQPAKFNARARGVAVEEASTRSGAGSRAPSTFTFGSMTITCQKVTATGALREGEITETVRFGACTTIVTAGEAEVPVTVGVHGTPVFRFSPKGVSSIAPPPGDAGAVLEFTINALRCRFKMLPVAEAPTQYANEESSTRRLSAFPSGFQEKIRAQVRTSVYYGSTGPCAPPEGSGTYGGTFWIESPSADLSYSPAVEYEVG